ncbi:MAG: squalene/phytoene synthase family protein [Acidobacteriota bacterium]|jgi:farnesyl-diphosphate farnesyltransferase|nr:squalene/phytoene synthase family protein [Acidobacteriota bacterium]
MKNMLKTGAVNADDLLRRVSRSFYLTLRILPRAIRPQLSLAYLLARASDTVADTGAIAVDKRQMVLSELRRSIQAVCARREPSAPDLSEFLQAADRAEISAKDAAERALLENFETLLGLLSGFTEDDREKIRAVLETITHGQQMDIQRFGGTHEHLNALSTDDELDAYTYEVAGCVGEFWTGLCLAHVFPRAAFNEKRLMSDAVRFGKGLQLVNILRDLPEDLRQGRCYIPRQSLSGSGLTPEDLLNPGAMRRFQPLYDDYLELAEDHLRAGWRYTAALPFGCVRVRLACAWPILIGVETLRRLRGGNILGDPRVKITRREIRLILVKSVLLYPRRKAWNRLFNI